MKSLLLELPEISDSKEEHEKTTSLIEKCLGVPLQVNRPKGQLPMKERKKTGLTTFKKSHPRKQEISFLQSIPANSVKQRQNLKMMESQQFMNILQHPAFLANPLETMQLHLKNVLASHKQNK